MSDPAVPPSPAPEPSAGFTGVPEAPSPPGVPTESSGLPPNLAACLACALSVVGGVVFLILEKKDKFVRFHAMQSVILGGVVIVFFAALEMFSWILNHIPFLGGLFTFLLGLAGTLVGLGYMALVIVTAVKAYSGKEWEIPYLGKIARDQLASRTPMAP